MRKPFVVIAISLVSVSLIVAGFYFNKETLSSIGCIVLIFFIIMAVRGKFRPQQKDSVK